MNWELGLKRISTLLWALVAMSCIGYTTLAILSGEEHSFLLWLLLFVLAIGVPFVGHKSTCWVIQGFSNSSKST